MENDLAHLDPLPLTAAQKRAQAEATARLNREFRIQAMAYAVVSAIVAAVLFVRTGGLQAPGLEVVVGSLLGGLSLGFFAYWLLGIAIAAVVAITTEIIPALIDRLRRARRVRDAIGIVLVAFVAFAYCAEHIRNNIPLVP